MIVAAELDASSERIVAYLNQRDLPLNVVFFQVFKHGEEMLLSRAWLMDPTETEVIATSKGDGPKEPWNGEFYVSFGGNIGRSWADARKYGYISAGGGSWYSKKLNLLKPNDRIWVNVPRSGFVGVGRVTGRTEPAATFTVPTEQGDRPVLDVIEGGDHLRARVGDEEHSEYYVPVKWLDTVTLDRAFNEIGLFGNQNTVCKPATPKWRHTVERLKKQFPKFDA